MPRRNDIQKILVIGLVAITLQLPQIARSQVFVDCVQNHTLTVPSVVGVVVDPYGAVIPEANVSLIDSTGRITPTQTDASGKFLLLVPEGQYKLKAELHAFLSSQVDLVVSHGVQQRQLYMSLGLAASYCPWVTTSKKDFEHNIRANKTKSKELN